jgi:cell division protein FtsB
MRRAVRLLLAAVAVGGVLFLFILPGRTWLAQGQASATAQRADSALAQENAALTKQVAQLQNTSYLEQLARQQYGLVMPGETAYGIIPPAVTPTTVPPPAKPHHHRSFWQSLEFWN